MKKYSLLIIALGMITVSGCAARNSKVVVDPNGVNMQQYQMDLVQCQQLAQQVESKAGKGLVGGAVVGGLVGDVVGNRESTRKGARFGAIAGTVKGARATKLERDRVTKNCMRNRGYAVLN